MEFEDKLDKGLSSVKLMIEEASNTEEPFLSLELHRLIQYLDILVKSYGNKKYKEEFKRYKEDKGLGKYDNKKDYKRDQVYAIVKELEFRDNFMEKEGYFERGYDNLLELFAEIFNHWGSYGKLLEEKEHKEPKTRAERKELDKESKQK